MELGVCVEQPQGDRVNPEGGEDGVGDALEGRHEILIGNGGDCLREHEPSLLALLEEIPGAYLVGQVDREHDDHPSPALGVDPEEACAPPRGPRPKKSCRSSGR